MNPLSLLWKDKMDIYRFVEEEINNITHSEEKLIYTNIACKYSMSNLNTPQEGTPKIVNEHKLFCSIDTDLKEGDKVVIIQRNGNKTTLSVGEGFPFTNHMEFIVKRSDTI